MQRQYRIRTQGHFRYVYRKGRHAQGKLFRVHCAKSRQLQVGFSVSRQVGKAVTRNLVKRRLRDSFRRLIPLLQNGSYVITANPAAAEASFSELHGQLVLLLKRLDTFRKTP